MGRRLKFPQEMRELTYGERVEALMYGEWVPATVNGQIHEMGREDTERVRLSDEDGGQFYGYPDTVRIARQ